MTITDLLSKLTSTDITVIIKNNETDKEIISFKAEGYESLDDTIENMAVKKWSIESATKIVITVEGE